jgi:hypothetical protein
MRKVCVKMVPNELTKELNKEKAKFANNFWRGKMIFWAMSSQMMKHGSTNAALKRSGKVDSGRLQILQSSIGPNQESKHCCNFFFYIRGIVH